MCVCSVFSFFFFNDTATTEIYTLSLHDALPICDQPFAAWPCIDLDIVLARFIVRHRDHNWLGSDGRGRSEEHTSELQSHLNLVCRLLLEKKKDPDRVV